MLSHCIKATGLPSVLAIVQSKIDILPKASNVRGSRAHLLEQELTQQLVYCWTSKRPDTRHSSCELIKECVRVDVLRIGTIKHAIGKLLPAQQQSVKALLVKMLDTLSPAEKENPINMPESKSQEIANLSPSNVKRRMRTANDDTRTSTDSSPLNEGLHKKLGQSCDASSTLKMSSKGIDSQPRPTPSDVLPLSSAGSSCAGSTKEQRMSLQSRQRDSWPEYPEQPDVRIHLEQLKKAWASMLPLSSVDILFPPEGVNKQDDCVSGAKLLSSILGNSSSENNVDDAIVDQLDLILKWLSIALSSRETTSGLQSLLGFMEQLFEVIQDRRYVLSDFEAGILLPFLVERKSMAKVRWTWFCVAG